VVATGPSLLAAAADILFTANEFASSILKRCEANVVLISSLVAEAGIRKRKINEILTDGQYTTLPKPAYAQVELISAISRKATRLIYRTDANM
jgi:hypothetical protein